MLPSLQEHTRSPHVAGHSSCVLWKQLSSAASTLAYCIRGCCALHPVLCSQTWAPCCLLFSLTWIISSVFTVNVLSVPPGKLKQAVKEGLKKKAFRTFPYTHTMPHVAAWSRKHCVFGGLVWGDSSPGWVRREKMKRMCWAYFDISF